MRYIRDGKNLPAYAHDDLLEVRSIRAQRPQVFRALGRPQSGKHFASCVVPRLRLPDVSPMGSVGLDDDDLWDRDPKPTGAGLLQE
jgi:hypothetical protein